MTQRKNDKATDEAPDAPQEPETDAPDVTTPPDAPQADLANVDLSYAGVEGDTGTVVDGDLDEKPLAELKALGNAKPDVHITAVLNTHGTWTWTARDVDGAEIARSPHPHTEAKLVENLTLLFSGSTVALHRTGDDKARKLA